MLHIIYSDRKSQIWLIWLPDGQPYTELPLIQLLFQDRGLSAELRIADLLKEQNRKNPRDYDQRCEGTWLLGLWWWSGMHLRVSAEAVQVAFDCLQGIITALLPCLSTAKNKREQRAGESSCGHVRKMARLSGCGERLTFGLTLLSSLSFCFCSSNCLLFLSSSSIFCCCSRRFLTVKKNKDITRRVKNSYSWKFAGD